MTIDREHRYAKNFIIGYMVVFGLSVICWGVLIAMYMPKGN